MGKIFSTVFGGKSSTSKQQSTSSSQNLAYQPVSQAYSPLMSYATSGADSLKRLLGGDTSEFDTYRAGTGYDFEKDRGESGIMTMLGSKGMRNSGAALKSLVSFNDGLQRKSINDYMDRLLGLTGIGFNAGQQLTQAGNTSQSQSTGKSSSSESASKEHDGIGKFIGKFIASDSRLKEDIKKVGQLDNGLNVYTYKYLGGKTTYVGVMADEVKDIMPEALGPTMNGFMTVDYGKVREAA